MSLLSRPSPCRLSPRPSVQRPCPPSPRAVLAFPGPSFCSETVRSLCDSKHKTTQRLTPWLPRESCTKGRGGLFFHAASCAAQRSDAAPARTSHLHTYKTRSRQTTALGTQRRRSAQPGKTTALLRLLFLRRKMQPSLSDVVGVAFFAAFNGAFLMWSRGRTSSPMLHLPTVNVAVPEKIIN